MRATEDYVDEFLRRLGKEKEERGRLVMRKIILEFLIGCFLSVVGFICFFTLFFLFEYYLDVGIFFGGDKGNVFCGLFLGVPIGALAGISLVDKLIFHSQGYNIYGIVAALILSQLGVILGIWLLDMIGGKVIFLIPFIVTCFSLVGYYIVPSVK